VDSYGRWVTDPSKFPPSGSANGIQVVANYVHSLGLAMVGGLPLIITRTPIGFPLPGITMT